MPDLKEILQNKNVVIPPDYNTFKDIFRHFKGKQVGTIHGDDGPLLDRSDEFYATPLGSTGLLQGDILENIPAVWAQKTDKGVMSAYKSEPGMAMVISNECDCENRGDNTSQSFIRLCPITLQSELLAGYPASKKPDIQGKLERNYYTEFFWMPAPRKNEEPLVADLSHFFSLSLSDVYADLGTGGITKKISLSQEEGYFLLLIKMAWFMLRPAAPDTARKDLSPWVSE